MYPERENAHVDAFGSIGWRTVAERRHQMDALKACLEQSEFDDGLFA